MLAVAACWIHSPPRLSQIPTPPSPAGVVASAPAIGAMAVAAPGTANRAGLSYTWSYQMFGRIVYLDIERRFGRIRLNGDPRHEFFFHRFDVQPELGFANLLGERVDFDAVDTPRGKAARRVRPVQF